MTAGAVPLSLAYPGRDGPVPLGTAAHQVRRRSDYARLRGRLSLDLRCHPGVECITGNANCPSAEPDTRREIGPLHEREDGAPRDAKTRRDIIDGEQLCRHGAHRMPELRAMDQVAASYNTSRS